MEQIQKLRLNALAGELPEALDVFICCASFENRCRSVADAIDPTFPQQTLVFQNEAIADVIGANANYLLNRFSTNSKSVEINPSDPVGTEAHLIGALSGAMPKSKRNILIDITTFTREALLILLNQLRSILQPEDTVIMAYTGALKYSSRNTTAESVWLTHGVRDIRSILGFPGSVQPSRKTHLILLVGFESERAIRLIGAYEPAFLSLGYGPQGSSISEEHHHLNVIFHEKVAALYGDVNRFEFAPNDPFITKEAILAQAAKFPQVNVVVGALNTKISTVGAGLAAFQNGAIQLCYAEADSYNFADYSAPSPDCYVFRLDSAVLGSALL